MNSYTLVEHSGLGGAALEPIHVTTARDERRVVEAGGVILRGYERADAFAFAMTRYRGDSLVPSGVAGSFSSIRFRELPLWTPDVWAATVLRLGEECDWSRPVSELTGLADAILAAPTPASSAATPL